LFARLAAEADSGAGILKAFSGRFQKIDAYIRQLADACTDLHPKAACPAIFAIGGYGRMDLAPYSDIDILFLFENPPDRAAQEWMQAMTSALWESGLKIGAQVKTLDASAEILHSDIHFMTSLLERRMLWGAKAPARKLEKMIRQHLERSEPTAFIAAKLAERDARHKKTGDHRYALQPDIKESKGGLRDIQTLLWLGNFLHGAATPESLLRENILTAQEFRIFSKAYDFFRTVRCHLHLLSGRASNRLGFELQPDIATRMGYNDKEPNIRTEKFMRDYFMMATETGYLTRIVCAALEQKALGAAATAGSRRPAPVSEYDGFPVISGRLTANRKDHFKKNPADILRIFEVSQASGIDIHPDALRQMRALIAAAPESLRYDETALRIFAGILMARKGAARTLRRLNEAGIIVALVPEFSNIFAHMQYDMYHAYTADEHTIETIDRLHAIENGDVAEEAPLACDLFSKTMLRRPLYAAMFFHDLGKGTGGKHAEHGAQIARKIMPLMGFDAAETDMAAWLVENHLFMTMTAFKRNLADTQTTADFAAAVQSPERLKLLTILTTADVMGVGPGCWNGWKAGLISDLYFQCAERISSGFSLSVPDQAEQAALLAKKKIRRMIGDSKEAFRYLSDFAPDFFWRALPADDIAATIKALDGHIPENSPIFCHIGHDQAQGLTRVTVMTADRKGLFATLTGALSAAGASVATAHIFTLSNGMALDIFHIQDARGHAHENSRFLKKTILHALSGRLDLQAEISARQKQSARKADPFDAPFRVIFDNSASHDCTLIEINGRDRAGFLHDIADALSRENVQVSAAKIATFGSRAVDVFYVKDVFGLKIAHPAKIARITAAIHRQMGAPMPEGLDRP
jgi:[protein-PII] uridylyltransferase